MPLRLTLASKGYRHFAHEFQSPQNTPAAFSAFVSMSNCAVPGVSSASTYDFGTAWSASVGSGSERIVTVPEEGLEPSALGKAGRRTHDTGQPLAPTVLPRKAFDNARDLTE